MFSDHVKEKGYNVIAPCTSLPCQWNKGQKRKKDHKPLHQAEYTSAKRNTTSLYNWNPREPKYQKNVNLSAVSTFVRNLQGSSVSMWETILPITYNDFEVDIDDTKYYESLRDSFVDNFKEHNNEILKHQLSAQISGTELQQNSPSWFQERLYMVKTVFRN